MLKPDTALAARHAARLTDSIRRRSPSQWMALGPFDPILREIARQTYTSIEETRAAFAQLATRLRPRGGRFKLLRAELAARLL